ncbi:replication terminator protein [Clostridium baratii]|uniref:replication terminator protein n=1 Tax=Clostridium baratii TaxID=1561 RepID=UPI0030D418C7
MEKMIDLEKFAEGALSEKFNTELKKVIENIEDPNTDFKKKRKLTVELTFESDENRELAIVDIVAKSKLVPAKALATKIVMGTDGKGGILASEYKKQVPGQSIMRVDEETGKIITTAEEKEPINLDGIKLVK